MRTLTFKIIATFRHSFILLCLAISNSLSSANVIYEGVLSPYPAPIFVPLTIGDTRLDNINLNLSTDGITLSKKHLHILGPETGREERSSIDGTMSVVPKHKVLGEVKLGVHNMNVDEVGIADLSLYYNFSGFNSDGRIGAVPLHDCSISFLYSERKFQISRGDLKETKEFRQASVSMLMQRLPMVEFEINGITEHFLIDSGGNSSVSFNEKTFERLVEGGIIKEGNTLAFSGSEQGKSKQRSGRIVKLELFGQRLDGMLVSSITGSQSIIGTAFLARFDSVLDLPGRCFHYKPIKNIKPKIDVELMLGIRLVFYEGSVVGMAVQDGGPLAKAGFSRYDRLDRLGDLSVGGFNILSLQESCWMNQGKELDIEFYHHSEDRHVTSKVTLPSAIYSEDNPKE